MSLTLTPRSTRTVVGLTAASLLVVGSGVAVAGPGKGGARGGSPTNGQVVHSESVVRTSTGFVTRLGQYGTVTAVSPTSLTVVSADAFSQTWVLSSSTRYRAGKSTATAASVVVGDTVGVSGVRSGTSNVAQLVDEKTPKASPTASPSATSTATTG